MGAAISEAERRHEQEATPTGNTGFSVDKLEINWGKNVTSKNREEAGNGYTEILVQTLPSGETCEYTHKRIEREGSPAVVDKVKDSDGLFHCDGVFPASISRIKNPDRTLKLDIAKWYKHGQLHRDGDLPALDSKADNLSGTQEWWKNGEMHRDGDKPAKIFFEKDWSVEEWYEHGKMCRGGDKPAQVWKNNAGAVTRECYFNASGEPHRDGNKPATVSYYKNGSVKEAIWYQNGIVSRDGDAPHILYTEDGRVEKRIW